jgi:hypothetical protein
MVSFSWSGRTAARPPSARACSRAALLAIVGLLATAATASASTVIGQLAPGNPPSSTCSISPRDDLQPTVTSGKSYAVPAGGQAITSWSTNASVEVGQMLEMKVFRKVGDPAIYSVVGHDGPRPIAPATLNTFPANVPVQPGDLLGFQHVNAADVDSACFFTAPGDTNAVRDGDLADGQSGDFSITTPDTDARINISAVVGFKPSNAFDFGKLTRNKKKGVATLPVEVPGPGSIFLTGKGLGGPAGQRHARAASKHAKITVKGKGTVKVRIRAKGKAKRRLNRTGKVKLKAKITYVPDGTATGDVVGDASFETKRVKLIKRD